MIAKKEEPKTEVVMPSSLATTVQEDSDEAEIIDDEEPDITLIEQTKAKFELKKLKEEKNVASSQYKGKNMQSGPAISV